MMFPSFIVNAQIQDWQSSGCIVDGVPTLKCVEVVFGNLLFMSGVLVMLILFIMFLVGSFMYLTSFGSAEKIKKAQGVFHYAILGLVVFLSAFLIIKTIDVLFLGNKGTLFHFEIPGP